MIVALWASWFVFFIIARVLGGLAMLAVFALAVGLPGDRRLRLEKMALHRLRGLSGVAMLGALLSLVGVYFLSQWWFTLINFAPVGVAVFGSVGIAAITWVATFIRKRQSFVVKLKTYHDDDNDDPE